MDFAMDSQDISECSSIALTSANVTLSHIPESGGGHKFIPGCVSASAADTSALKSITLDIPQWEVALASIALTIILIATIVGNALIIMSVLTYRPLRIPPNFFIASLAMTDIAVAFLILPLGILYCLNGRWTLGATLCQVWKAVNVLCCSASMLHLCAIAVDRYWAIKNPFAYKGKRTRCRVLLVIGAIWFLACIFSSTLLFGREEFTKRFSELSVCALRTFDRYLVYMLIAAFYLTLLITIIMYALIFVTMHLRLRVKSPDLRGASLDCQVNATRVHFSEIPDQLDVETRDQIHHISRDEVGDTKGPKVGRMKHGTNTPSNSKSKDLCIDLVRFIPKGGGSGRDSLLLLQVQSYQSADMDKGDDYKEVMFGQGPSNLQGITATELREKMSSSTTTPSGRVSTAQKIVKDRRKVSQSKERKLIRTLALVMGVFILCWIPYSIMNIIILCSSFHPSQKVELFLTWLGYTNSTLNPIIYTVYNREFRKAFKKILRIPQ